MALNLEFKEYPVNMLERKIKYEVSVFSYNTELQTKDSWGNSMYYKDMWPISLTFIYTLFPCQSLVCSSECIAVRNTAKEVLRLSSHCWRIQEEATETLRRRNNLLKIKGLRECLPAPCHHSTLWTFYSSWVKLTFTAPLHCIDTANIFSITICLQRHRNSAPKLAKVSQEIRINWPIGEDGGLLQSEGKATLQSAHCIWSGQTWPWVSGQGLTALGSLSLKTCW